MALDPVTARAFRTPLFASGVVMLAAGLIPVTLGLISGWDAVSGVSLLSVFAPIGALLMALARSRASVEWKEDMTSLTRLPSGRARVR